MKILVDYLGCHTLAYSIHHLLHDRLGHELYYPLLGNDWKSYGVHCIMSNDKWNPINIETDSVERFPAFPYNHDIKLKCISFKKFKEMKFDLLVCTGFRHDVSFYELGKNFNIPVIRHIANIQEKPINCKNVLLSTKEPMPKNVNWISYCPEQYSTFVYKEPEVFNKITSYSGEYRAAPHRVEAWSRFNKLLPEYDFKMYGRKGADGEVKPENMYKSIHETTFVWHLKVGGCGYISREALASGRPLIVNKEVTSLRFKTLAVDYLQDGLNCIDINPKIRSFQDSVKMIRSWSDPVFCKEKSREILEDFNEKINFTKEASDIDRWLENIVKKGS